MPRLRSFAATDGPTPGTAVTSALKSVRDAWLVDMPASRWMGSGPGRSGAGRLGAERLELPGRPPGAPVPYDGPWFSPSERPGSGGTGSRRAELPERSPGVPISNPERSEPGRPPGAPVPYDGPWFSV